MRSVARLTPLVLTVFAGVSPVDARAQSGVTTADLTGSVFDQTRSVIVGARVLVQNNATNLQRTALSGRDGRFLVAALPPATYTVTVAAAGFAPHTLPEVSVALGSAGDLEVTLTVEAFTTTVPVNAPAPLVDLQRTAVSGVIGRSQIDNLPANGRDFISFALLLPGVSTDRTPQQGSSATSGLTFAGQRARSNNIMVDGVDNNDSVNGAVRAVFSQEAVQEFQVLTGSYSAEFGNASAGIVNIITKSGTNERAGSAFAFVRDETLNAREYFEKYNPAGARIDRRKAPYAQKQFGATLGGPLRRDRLFYFVSVERLDIDANNFVTITDADADVLRRTGFTVDTGNVPFAVESTQFLGKLDWQLNTERHLGVRFNSADTLNENIEPWGGQVARSRGALRDSNDAMLAASFTSFLTSTALNELRAQIAYRDEAILSLDPACGGRCDRDDEGGPTLEITGAASVGRQRYTPAPRQTVRYQVVDTFFQQRGRHQLKTGFDFNHINHFSGALPLHFGGRYIFAPLPAIPGLLPAPVSAIQALALGLPAAYVQGYGNSSSRYASQALAVFAQDDWAVGRDLTVKLGARYQNQFWPNTAYNVRGLGSYTFPPDNNNVAPRLAAAWRPWGSRATSIHAAYGLFYENHLTGLLGITDIVDGTPGGVRTLVQRFPASIAAWNATGRRLPEPSTPFPSLVITIDPRLETPYAQQTSIGIGRELPSQLSLTANFLYVRGHNQVGTLDYNPLVPALGADRRPEDEVRGGVAVPGTSASILQYTSFGETWYRGLTVALNRRPGNRYDWQASYTLSKAEDNSTDYQSAFLPQTLGTGRDRSDPYGLPVGFDPGAERGPSLQDQRHRLVVSGSYLLPRDIRLAAIATLGSGRPYNLLAGVDLNGDGNGGAFPPDRARRIPSDAASSVGRNTETLPVQATVDVRMSHTFARAGRTRIDGIVEVFNLFNRTNFAEINNIFGAGSYPATPLPTFGQFEKAGPPRQAQVALKATF